MPDLDYPLVFECSNCKARTTVEWSDAQNMPPDPDTFEAIHVVLQDRGWLRDEIQHLIFCPDCADPERAD